MQAGHQPRMRQHDSAVHSVFLLRSVGEAERLARVDLNSIGFAGFTGVKLAYSAVSALSWPGQIACFRSGCADSPGTKSIKSSTRQASNSTMAPCHGSTRGTRSSSEVASSCGAKLRPDQGFDQTMPQVTAWHERGQVRRLHSSTRAS